MQTRRYTILDGGMKNPLEFDEVQSKTLLNLKRNTERQ